MYEIVNIQGKTIYDDKPSLTFNSGGEDDDSSLEIIYDASEIDKMGNNLQNSLKFLTVIDFHLRIEDYFYDDPYHSDDFYSGLVKILDSKLIDYISKNHGNFSSETSKFGNSVIDNNITHYRIIFSGFGVLDIVCLFLESSSKMISNKNRSEK